MRHIVIGDVHGCVVELQDLLEVAQYSPGDRLILLGDLVDRGPDSGGVVRLARELGAESVLGNHEEKHLRWRRHEARVKAEPGYVNPMQPFNETRQAEHDSLSEEDWAYLEKLPHWVHITGTWYGIHAGAEPGLGLDKQRPNALMRLRYLKTATGRMASLNELQEASLPNPEFTFWTSLWDGPENLVYGHHVHQQGSVMSVDNPGGHCIGIDTGCCFGGHLTAVVFKGDQFTSTYNVKARKTYREYRGWGE